jgi:hypothetical protein
MNIAKHAVEMVCICLGIEISAIMQISILAQLIYFNMAKMGMALCSSMAEYNAMSEEGKNSISATF